jgi:hypothetical protein
MVEVVPIQAHAACETPWLAIRIRDYVRIVYYTYYHSLGPWDAFKHLWLYDTKVSYKFRVTRFHFCDLVGETVMRRSYHYTDCPWGFET